MNSTRRTPSRIGLAAALVVAGSAGLSFAEPESSTLDLTRPRPSPLRDYRTRIELQSLDWRFDPSGEAEKRTREALPPGSVPRAPHRGAGASEAGALSAVESRPHPAEPSRQSDPDSLSRNWLLPPPVESADGVGAPAGDDQDVFGPDRTPFGEPLQDWLDETSQDARPAPEGDPAALDASDNPLDRLSDETLRNEVESAVKRRIQAGEPLFQPALAGPLAGATDEPGRGLEPAIGWSGPVEAAGTLAVEDSSSLPAGVSGGRWLSAPGRPAPSVPATSDVTRAMAPSVLSRAADQGGGWQQVFRGLADALASSRRALETESLAGTAQPPTPFDAWQSPAAQDVATRGSPLTWRPPDADALGEYAPLSPTIRALTGFEPVAGRRADPSRSWSTLRPIDIGPAWQDDPGPRWDPLPEASHHSGAGGLPARIQEPPISGLESVRLPALQPDKTENLDLNPRTLRTLMP